MILPMLARAWRHCRVTVPKRGAAKAITTLRDRPFDLPMDRTGWSMNSAARTLTHVSGLIVEMVPDGNGGWCLVLRHCPSVLSEGESIALVVLALGLWMASCRNAAQWKRCAQWNSIPESPSGAWDGE